MREEHKLKVFENRELRKIFGPKKDEVGEEWRKMHNELINDLYSSPNNIRVIKSKTVRWAGHVARMEKKKVANMVFVGKPGGKIALGSPRRRWEDNKRGI